MCIRDRASNPECCLTPDEWRARFAHWIEHGAPEDLLKASIYFDLRPLCGNAALAQALQAMPAREAVRVPRFLKQLAGNTLRYRVPLNWRGAIETQAVDGREMLDLKPVSYTHLDVYKRQELIQVVK